MIVTYTSIYFIYGNRAGLIEFHLMREQFKYEDSIYCQKNKSYGDHGPILFCSEVHTRLPSSVKTSIRFMQTLMNKYKIIGSSPAKKLLVTNQRNPPSKTVP